MLFRRLTEMTSITSDHPCAADATPVREQFPVLLSYCISLDKISARELIILGAWIKIANKNPESLNEFTGKFISFIGSRTFHPLLILDVNMSGNFQPLD